MNAVSTAAGVGTGPPADALGESEVFLGFMESLSRAARVERPVLIMGERGTGKELAAARLHYLSPRWQGPLVALNCAALTPTLIESELFGYEPGAFTGAAARRAGRFETAHQGSLFLDEIGAIPLTVQEKILRVVEYGVFERVGSSHPTQVEVRIIAATNADLPAMAQTGEFKQDLLDRLSFEVLAVPPLRQRREDVMLLARHFAVRVSRELGRETVPRFTPLAEAELMAYHWPGNVRELKNVVERAVHRSSSGLINEIVVDPFAPLRTMALAQPGITVDLAADPKQADPGPGPIAPHGPEPLHLPIDFKAAVAEFEQDILAQALAESRFNQAAAARRLGLTYHQLRALLKKHGGIKEVSAAGGY